MFAFPWFPYKINKIWQIQVSLYKQLVQINIHREKMMLYGVCELMSVKTKESLHTPE